MGQPVLSAGQDRKQTAMRERGVTPQSELLTSPAGKATPRLPKFLKRPIGSASSRTRYRLVHYVAIPWLFILPILLLHIFVVAIPALTGVYYALTDWSGMGEASFIGLENFRRLIFEDEAFRRALGNN